MDVGLLGGYVETETAALAVYMCGWRQRDDSSSKSVTQIVRVRNRWQFVFHVQRVPCGSGMGFQLMDFPELHPSYCGSRLKLVGGDSDLSIDLVKVSVVENC
jgi:hypothetical protein